MVREFEGIITESESTSYGLKIYINVVNGDNGDRYEYELEHGVSLVVSAG